MLYAKDNTKEQQVGYKHTCALMVLQMLCRWLVQIALCHSHTFPRLLLVYSSSQGVDQCECDGSWHKCRIIGRTTQCVRGSISPVSVLVEDGPVYVHVCSMRWEAVVWQVCAPCVFMLVWDVDCSGQTLVVRYMHTPCLTPHCWQSHFVIPDRDVGDSGWGHLRAWRWGSHHTSCSSRIGDDVCVTECPPIKTWEGVVLKECTLCSCVVDLFQICDNASS